MNGANKYFTPHRGLKREKTDMSTDSESEEIKESVQVYCRLRPPKQGATLAADIRLLSTELLSLTTPPNKGITKEVQYKFHHIFTGYSTQSEIFRHIAVPLLEDLVCGKNGLLFTYGVTGSGKTYTLTGDQQDPGIMPRCIDTVFNSIGEYQAAKYIIKSDKMNGFEIQSEDDALKDRLQAVRSSSKRLKVLNRKPSAEKICYVNDGSRIQNVNPNNLYAVFVSYVEIYNNNVFDLLDETGGKNLQNKMLREDAQKNMYVNGVVELEVKSSEEAFEAFYTGQQRKKMAATNLNADSSRSHSIFNIRLVQVEQIAINENGNPTIPNDNVMKIGQLSLVDLAGSERTNRTNNTGVRLKEASSINNSLMSLRSCLEILRENQKCKMNRLVPYRDSRLTYLFKRYFEGDGNVKMIVCVNPSIEDIEENLQVLKFAEMIQDIKISKAEVKATPLKRTMKANNKENRTPASVKKASTCSLLPPVDIVKFDFENFQDCKDSIDKLITTLKLREKRYGPLKRETDEMQANLRKRLEKINSENVLTKNDIKSLKAAMQKEKKRNCSIQIKLTDAETANENLKAKNSHLEEVVRSLHNTLNEKDRIINQKILEKERHKQKLILDNEKKNQELDAKLRRQREHLNAVMKAKDDKIRFVKEIIDSEMPPADLNLVETESECPPKFQSTQTHVAVSSSGHRRNMTGNTTTPRHRRSRSAGPEVWLEHNAVKPVPLGTVFQPSMKKRKSVSKLDKASDVVHPKQSKYCLITQEPDTDGETETKMYKADIVPTCGGGAQVIFNDVERLRQESPTRSPK